jgi:hypothetical protein
MSGQPGLFDLDERYAALSRTGDPLERLAAVVDFEVFRSDLDTALARSDGSKGGRPPMDAVMMFKVLVLQALYGLADEQTEFQIRDRLSFMRFLCGEARNKDPVSGVIGFQEGPPWRWGSQCSRGYREPSLGCWLWKRSPRSAGRILFRESRSSRSAAS